MHIHLTLAIPIRRDYVAMFMYVPCIHLFYAYSPFSMQSCQTSNFNDEVTYSIALAGTEKMHIDPDGVPYLFYTAFGQKYGHIYLRTCCLGYRGHVISVYLLITGKPTFTFTAQMTKNRE